MNSRALSLVCIVIALFTVWGGFAHAQSSYQAAYDYYCADESYSKYEDAEMDSTEELRAYCKDISYVKDEVVPDEATEKIINFSVDLGIEGDGSVKVTELIEYDFGDENRHGIYREIPHTGTLRVHSVSNEKGISHPYTTEKTRFSLFGNDQETSIKIGDPDKYVTGINTYKIQYTSHDTIRRFDDYDEIYWNVTGNGWDVPVVSSDVWIHLPEAVDQNQLRFSCYYGLEYSTTRCDESVVYEHKDGKVNRIGFSRDNLSISEGLTVAVGFPKGIVGDLPLYKKIYHALEKYVLAGVSLLLVMMWRRKAFLYWLRRRKFYKQNVIVPEYDPGEIDPLEAEILQRGVPKNSAVTAQIIYLATKGYLVIKKDDDEYVFVGTGKDQASLPEYSKQILKEISDKRQSDLVMSFWETTYEVKSKITASMKARQYTESAISAGDSRAAGIVMPFFFALNPGVFVWFLAGQKVGFIFSVFCILLGLSAIVFKVRINRLTEKGLAAERKILGLKRYIQIAEANRINFHNGPEKDQALFEKLLPYAMIFGLEKDWAKQFEGIHSIAPTWYHDGAFNSFAPIEFASRLSTMSRSTTAAITSAPSSSGGGSSSGSGGGGSSGRGSGGGGGGSW